MKTGNPITVNGTTFRRTHINKLRVGDIVCRCRDGAQVPTVMGTVVEVEKQSCIRNFRTVGFNRLAILDNGTRMTYRGWANKRLWRKV